MEILKAYIDTHSDRFISELKDFLRIPSVSAMPEHAGDIENAADLLSRQLIEIGMHKVEKVRCGGNPIVYAERCTDPSLATVLFYGHYDVQPADPIDLWESAPFSPEIRNGKIYARGACDDKSQVMLIIKSLESMIATHSLPCNVKVMFEGEEETGSGSMERFLKENEEMLKADAFVVCDTSMPNPNEPTLISGLRGICFWELSVRTGDEDQHSGMQGGQAENAAAILCRLLASMKDVKGNIMIPGFHDGLQDPDRKNYSQKDLVTVFPSLEINGVSGGYTGDGPKTIIPAMAQAKFSCRIADGQSPQQIHASMVDFVNSNLPEYVSHELKLTAASSAVKVDQNTAAFQSACIALKREFGVSPSVKRIGGTIPVVSQVKDLLGLEPILLGFGLDDDHIHAPNESFLLSNFFKGIRTVSIFCETFSVRHNHPETDRSLSLKSMHV